MTRPTAQEAPSPTVLSRDRTQLPSKPSPFSSQMGKITSYVADRSMPGSPRKSQLLCLPGGFLAAKGCCDRGARAPLLLVFPTAPTQEFPRQWEQGPAFSAPGGFGEVHQEDGFAPLPLALPAIWFSSHPCRGAAKAALGIGLQGGRRLGTASLGDALAPRGRAAPGSPSPAFPLLISTDTAGGSEA